jgi:hypothetical protein
MEVALAVHSGLAKKVILDVVRTSLSMGEKCLAIFLYSANLILSFYENTDQVGEHKDEEQWIHAQGHC